MQSSHLDVINLSKGFRGNPVIEGLDFVVGEGELASLLGPSGCGKTTLLRIIAGLIKADQGDVVLSGKTITRKPAHKRNVSVVFQNYALFPHLSVAENVAFGLRARGSAKNTLKSKIRDVLSLVRMEEYADRSIAMLSGGQQQRVAVARALVVEPELLLLDEPFSALDRKLRETMQVELKTLLRDRGITSIFVTHDQEEALAVSDRIAVMNSGRIEQFAPPSELYARPVTGFVLDFVGLSTSLSGMVVGQSDNNCTIKTRHGTVQINQQFELASQLTIAVRPELIRVNPESKTTRSNSISVTLSDVMCLGSKTLLHGIANHDERIVCEVPGIDVNYSRGDVVEMSWKPSDTLAYNAC